MQKTGQEQITTENINEKAQLLDLETQLLHANMFTVEFLENEQAMNSIIDGVANVLSDKKSAQEALIIKNKVQGLFSGIAGVAINDGGLIKVIAGRQLHEMFNEINYPGTIARYRSGGMNLQIEEPVMAASCQRPGDEKYFKTLAVMIPQAPVDFKNPDSDVNYVGDETVNLLVANLKAALVNHAIASRSPEIKRITQIALQEPTNGLINRQGIKGEKTMQVIEIIHKAITDFDGGYIQNLPRNNETTELISLLVNSSGDAQAKIGRFFFNVIAGSIKKMVNKSPIITLTQLQDVTRAGAYNALSTTLLINNK